MSEGDNENAIWEYKPLTKTKRQETSELSNGTVTKRRRVSKRKLKRTTPTVEETSVNLTYKSKDPYATEDVCIYDNESRPPSTVTSSQSKQNDGTLKLEASTPGGFCPICQMPFSILVVQSQRWHVAECFDTPGDGSKECPDGIKCCSTIPSHYKRYSHTLLAHSRATNELTLDSLSQERKNSKAPGPNFCTEKGVNSSSASQCSQDSALNTTAPGSSPIITHRISSTPSKLTNALLLLRSPALEDCRKKKGWSPSVKRLQSASISQKTKTEGSTSVNTDKSSVHGGGFVKAEASSSSDDGISYSPFSEFPLDLKINGDQPRKKLFPNSSLENENNESLILFSDSLSIDDEALSIDDVLFSDLSQYETKEEEAIPLNDTKMISIGSLTDSDHQTRFTAANNSLIFPLRGEMEETSMSSNSTSSIVQSPQSVVLEQLRNHILMTNNNNNTLHLNSSNECSSLLKTEQMSTAPKKVPSSLKVSSTQLSQTGMAPIKGNQGSASGLKQMDIGVFFGLKPLKEQVVDSVLSEQKPSLLSAEVSRKRKERGVRQRRNGDASVAVASNVEETTDSGNTQNTQGEGWKWGGGRRKKSWNRGNADGEPEEPRRCPFYKKIPGTKFVVDAFQYGVIDGITAYFLTHFHSDHYGGLKKHSTVPIYCNKITGNLVKSKLKVEERYVHILPMNTEVTVEGVRVILLEANHCPGAAMLLLFLPDGQVVLHVGDFRADPSMEHYPQLQSCRVQTLYLDTTYCSPDYTFPTQQEVISFAASTAFECVTLNPRTLIVCGSYSVGKEKVFLALAEALGSKVCMSRDKFNTMCCLESEHIRRLITTDWKAAQVHVLPMMQLKFKNLQAHLSRFAGQYDQLVAFKPTGWTFSQKVEVVEDIQPHTDGNISIYGIPYSEHSSFLEMKRFVQWLRPLKIIPTVNVGSWTNRKAMEKFFSEWLSEAKANAK